MKRLIRGSVEGGRRRRDCISKVAQQVPLDSVTHGLDEGCLSNLVGRVVCIEVGHAARLTPQNRAWRGTYCRLPHDTDSTRPLPMVSPYQTPNDAFGVTISSAARSQNASDTDAWVEPGTKSPLLLMACAPTCRPSKTNTIDREPLPGSAYSRSTLASSARLTVAHGESFTDRE